MTAPSRAKVEIEYDLTKTDSNRARACFGVKDEHDERDAQVDVGVVTVATLGAANAGGVENERRRWWQWMLRKRLRRCLRASPRSDSRAVPAPEAALRMGSDAGSDLIQGFGLG